MVLKSRTRDDAIVVLTGLTNKNGEGVLAAVHLNKKSGFNEVNRIASVYGKKNCIKFISENIAENNLLYINKTTN